MNQPAAEQSIPMVLESRNGGVATLTLNRAAQFNALSQQMMDALQAALDAIAQDDTVRVVVLAAEGRAFCAGHDLKQMRATPALAYYQTLFR
ncbi:MAG: enoyl-CoA hydratase/isomerase family protein, partial [Oxalobacteraceae bacterium]